MDRAGHEGGPLPEDCTPRCQARADRETKAAPERKKDGSPDPGALPSAAESQASRPPESGPPRPGPLLSATQTNAAAVALHRKSPALETPLVSPAASARSGRRSCRAPPPAPHPGSLTRCRTAAPRLDLAVPTRSPTSATPEPAVPAGRPCHWVSVAAP